MADIVYCDWCIIKVVDSDKNDITPITIDYINSCEKYYVPSIT